MGALRTVRAKQILLKSQVSSTSELCSGVCGCLSRALFAQEQFSPDLMDPHCRSPCPEYSQVLWPLVCTGCGNSVWLGVRLGEGEDAGCSEELPVQHPSAQSFVKVTVASVTGAEGRSFKRMSAL